MMNNFQKFGTILETYIDHTDIWAQFFLHERFLYAS